MLLLSNINNFKKHLEVLRYDKKTNKFFSSYNLVDLERCGIIKYDILGLGTLSPIMEIRKIFGIDSFDYKAAIEDENVIKAFDDSLLEAYKNVIETREKQMNVLKEIELVENLKMNYQNKEGEVENKKEIEDSNDLDLQIYKEECLEIKDKNECIEVETCSWNQIMNICKLK